MDKKHPRYKDGTSIKIILNYGGGEKKKKK